MRHLISYKTIQQLSFLFRPVCWVKGHRWVYASMECDPKQARACRRCEKREGM